MPQTARQKARRQLRTLAFPKHLRKVLHTPRYWTVAFVELFLEHCDHVLFEDAKEGLLVAEGAPRLVKRLPDDACRREERHVLQVRALAVVASAHRRVRNLATADRIYQQAEAIPINALARADLCRRIALLRCDQRRFKEALSLLEYALQIFEQSESASGYARILVCRGEVHSTTNNMDGAFQDFLEALLYTDAKKDPYTHCAATHNLAIVVGLTGSSPDELAEALKLLKQAKRLSTSRTRSVPRLKLCWLEGILLMKFGAMGQAEVVFQAARRGFKALGLPYEVAITSLDLGRLYRELRQWNKLARLAADTCRLLQGAEKCDDEIFAALMQWRRASEAQLVTETVIETARQLLLQQLQKLPQTG